MERHEEKSMDASGSVKRNNRFRDIRGVTKRPSRQNMSQPLDSSIEITNDEGVNNMGSTIPCQKPKIFRLKGKISFKNWVTNFNNFADAANIPRKDRIKSMLTFVDSQAMQQIETLGLSQDERENPDKAIKKILQSLTDHKRNAENKFKIFTRTQKENQDIATYATSLKDWITSAYGEPEESMIRNEILLQSFINGIRSKIIKLTLLKENPKTFEEALQIATDNEIILATIGNENLGLKNQDMQENLYNNEINDNNFD